MGENPCTCMARAGFERSSQSFDRMRAVLCRRFGNRNRVRENCDPSFRHGSSVLLLREEQGYGGLGVDAQIVGEVGLQQHRLFW